MAARFPAPVANFPAVAASRPAPAMTEARSAVNCRLGRRPIPALARCAACATESIA